MTIYKEGRLLLSVRRTWGHEGLLKILKDFVFVRDVKKLMLSQKGPPQQYRVKPNIKQTDSERKRRQLHSIVPGPRSAPKNAKAKKKSE